VAGDPTRLNLTLSGTAPTRSQTLALLYTDLAGDNTTGVVQDSTGNDMATLAAPGRNVDTFSSSASVSVLANSYTNLLLTGTAAIGTGNSGNNRVRVNQATAVANVLTGGDGIDDMDAGNGSDIYVINSSAHHSAAEINDSGATGTDELRFASTTTGQTLTVFSSDTGLERATIGTGVAAAAVTTGTTALNIDAAAAPNGLSLTGNNGPNTLTGTAFADLLTGNAGNDTLSGGAGSDTINGGDGTDPMDGADGSDLYLITSSSQHTAAEIADSGATGSDELRFASTTANQILTLFSGDTGLESITIGTGTAIAPVITGTTVLSVNAAAAPNGLSISGNNGVNTLTGTAFADTLTGNGGNDTLIGGLGNDTLSGGLGADIFRFHTPLNAATNVDRVTDFAIAENDRIQLENAVFSNLPITGTLAATAFLLGSAATTSAHRILYNSLTGDLLYDPDGSSPNAPTLFATLNPGLALTAASFSIT